MTSNPTPGLVPGPIGDDDPADEPVQEVDGETVLDPDADPDRIDSADADRIAAEEGEG
jgi:hypothetical protein